MYTLGGLLPLRGAGGCYINHHFSEIVQFLEDYLIAHYHEYHHYPLDKLTPDGYHHNKRGTVLSTEITMSATQIKKISWWHESILDWELTYPDKSMGDCAQHFSVSESWLSVIRNSDLYRAYSAKRRADHNSNVSASVIDGVEDLAKISLEVLKSRIDKGRDTIPLPIVTDSCSMALKALGFGGNTSRGNGGSTQVNVVVGAVDGEVLSRAREKMRRINELENKETILIEEEVDPHVVLASEV